MTEPAPTPETAPETQPAAENRTVTTKRVSAWLCERWPHLFDTGKPVPLAVGIRGALIEALAGEATEAQVKSALADWCSKTRYRQEIKAGAGRHGLDGAQQGVVTEEQAATAAAAVKAQTAAAAARWKAKKANIAEMKRKAAEAAVKRELRAAAEAKKAEAEAAKLAAQQAAAAKRPPPGPARGAAPAKPAGPVIIVKKRRFGPPGEGG